MQDRILGTVMPVLEVTLEPGEAITAESGELSWMGATVAMRTSTRTAGGGMLKSLKRTFSGASYFMSEYTAVDAAGVVAFAAQQPGTILPIDVGEGSNLSFLAHKRAFMAGTSGIALSTGFQQRLGAGVFGGDGFILQRIGGTGRAWVQLSGEVVTYDLQAGQLLRVHPGHVAMFQETVCFGITTVKGIRNKLFGAELLFLAELRGPGRVWLQSLPIDRLAAAVQPYLQREEAEAAGGGLIAGLLGRR